MMYAKSKSKQTRNTSQNNAADEILQTSGDLLDEKRRAYRNDYVAQKVKCVYCQYTGFMLCSHNENKNIYAFRCNKCDASERQQLSMTIEKWDAASMIHKFTPII